MEIDYWHTFDFPEYSVKGRDNSPEKLKVLGIPEKLTGKTVLDIGAWDGYFSFVCEKRGASVSAVDTFVWQKDLLWDGVSGTYKKNYKKEGFEKARTALKSSVRDYEIEVEDIGQMVPHDIVLCLGILYHMKNPYKVLEALNKVTKEMLIIETHTDMNYLAIPAMAYYPEYALNNDPCNYWGPNLLCILDMLKRVGFKNSRVHFYNGVRAVIHAFK